MERELNGVLLAEQIGAIGRITHATNSIAEQKGAAQLVEGEIVTATVERSEGGEVVLRLESGGLLRAAARGDVALSQGAVIEAVVNRLAGEQLLLKIVDLEAPAKSSPAGKNPLTSQQALSDMLSALSRNPEISAKAARFLAENGLLVTAENLQALSQITKGTGLGALLGKILALIGEGAESAPNAMEKPPTGNAETLLSRESPPDAAGNVSRGSQGGPQAADEGQTGQIKTTAQQPSAPQAVQTEGEGVPAQQPEPPVPAEQPDAVPKERPGDKPPSGALSAQEDPLKMLPQGGQGENAMDPPAEEARQVSGGVPATQPQPQYAEEGVGLEALPFGESPWEEAAPQPNGYGRAAAMNIEQEEGLERLVKELFVRPGEQSSAEIKKNVEEAPRMLQTLKSALVQSDIKNKELCLKTIDQAIRQMEFSEKTARFDYIQLPLAGQGEGNTAELFVFRRKRAKPGEEGGEGTTILIALDTQKTGRVETLLVAQKDKISLEFRLEQTERAEDFKRNSAVLEQAVEAAGFSLTGIRFSGLEMRTTLLNAAETAGPAVKENVRGVDIRI